MMRFSFFLLAFISLFFNGESQTYCNDAYECQNEDIDDTYVYCNGYYGCNDADITATSLYTYGDYGASLVNATATSTSSYGYMGLYYAELETTYLYSYGYYSSYVAEIEPRYTSFNGYFYGYMAGYGSDVSCYSGDTCRIYCGYTGCLSMDFYCYSGATCLYYCTNSVSSSYCPSLYGGIESDLTDEDIKKIYLEKKKEKKEKEAERIKNGKSLEEYLPKDDAVYESPVILPEVPPLGELSAEFVAIPIGAMKELKKKKKKIVSVSGVSPMFQSSSNAKLSIYIGLVSFMSLLIGVLMTYCFMKNGKDGYQKILDNDY